MRHHGTNYAGIQEIDRLIGINEGGTGGQTIEEAVQNMNGISTDLFNQANGIGQLDQNRFMKPSQIPSLLTGPTINGPVSVFKNAVTLYTITNFDAYTSYTIAAINGSVSLSHDSIIYTAPDEEGDGGFILNDKLFSILIKSNIPLTPSIVYPVDGYQSAYKNLTFLAGDFLMSEMVNDIHECSDWQIASDSAFTNIIYSSIASTSNLTSFDITNLPANTQYYIRVRYKGALTGYSHWSNTVAFKTRLHFVPVYEAFKFSNSNSLNEGQFGYSVAMNRDGNKYVIGVPTGLDLSLLSKDAQVYENNILKAYIKEFFQTEKMILNIPNGSSLRIEADSEPAIDRVYTANQTVLIPNDVTTLTLTPSYPILAAAPKITFKSIQTTISNIVVIDPRINNHFGHTSAISGDGKIVAISSYRGSFNGIDRAGSVLTLTNNAAVDNFEFIGPSYASTNDLYGHSIALNEDGSYLAIGSPNGKKANIATGLVYLYKRVGYNWIEETVFEPPNGLANDGFGYSVSFDKNANRLAVGAIQANNSKGAVYIYVRNNELWNLEHTYVSNTGIAGDQLGSSVSFDENGTRLVIGAPHAIANGYFDIGTVHVVKRTNTVWSTETIIMSSLINYPAKFGYKVQISEDSNVIVISAPDYGLNARYGAVLIYSRSGTAWAFTSIIQASDKQMDDHFGSDISFAKEGTALLIGAPLSDPSNISNSGAVYLYN